MSKSFEELGVQPVLVKALAAQQLQVDLVDHPPVAVLLD